MKQLLEQVKHVLDNGAVNFNERTGYNTYSDFGLMAKYDLSEGFPIPTTKNTNLKLIARELKWFLEGSTSAKRLRELGCGIWNTWDVIKETNVSKILSLLSTHDAGDGYTLADKYNNLASTRECFAHNDENKFKENLLAFCNEHGVDLRTGELGPVYGKMWRNWPTADGGELDQLQNIVDVIKLNPSSRRMVVSAWNPEFLPDEKADHATNIANGKQVLPPCHLLYQFSVREASTVERILYAMDDNEELMSELLAKINQTALADAELTVQDLTSTVGRKELHELMGDSLDMIKDVLDELEVPTERLDMLFFMRSNDLPIGAPYNIASYSLLNIVVSKVTGTIPGVVTHMTGDAHVYENQLPGVEEWLSREPKQLPKIKILNEINSLEDFDPEQVELEGYDPDPFIKIPVAS